jgi:hypothetical protein
MKKITKPAEREEAVYYSDFSGRCFGEWHPPVEVKIEFNYGSGHDGSVINLHLTDDEVNLFLDVIKKKMSEDYKNFLKHKLDTYNKEYDESISFRDWTSCDRIGNSVDLLRELLDIKSDE